MRRNFVLKKLPDHHRRIDLKEELESRQCDNLHHRAGREIGSQYLPSRFIDVAMVTNVGGENVQRANNCRAAPTVRRDSSSPSAFLCPPSCSTKVTRICSKWLRSRQTGVASMPGQVSRNDSEVSIATLGQVGLAIGS